jgi:hypothetical protein
MDYQHPHQSFLHRGNAVNRFLSAAVAFGMLLGLTATAQAADEKKKKKKNEGPDLSALFAKLDTNNDKKVTKDEFNAFKGLQAQKAEKAGKEPKGLSAARDVWFSKLDTNNDGSLTFQEFSKIKDVIAANPIQKKKKKDAN